MADKSLIIQQSKLSEVFQLAPRLREDDKRECLAAGKTPLKALKDAVRNSYIKRSVYTKDGLLIGMYGSCTKGMPKGYAAIWFLGSRESEKYPITFVREGKNFINEVLQDYSIFNLVYKENKGHIEYLKRLGLTVDETKPIKLINGEFYAFYLQRQVSNLAQI